MLDHIFNLKPSISFISAMSIFLCLTVLILLFLPISLFLKLISVFFIFTYGFQLLWKIGFLRGRLSILKFRKLADGLFELHLHQSKEAKLARIYGDSIMTPFISILRFHLIDANRVKPSCIILKDSLPKDDYRRLLSALKMSSLQLVS